MAKTILVVDDDEIFRSMMGDVLRAAGYDVVLAEDGDRGYEIFVQKQPDLILLDLLMPGRTGARLVQSIRQHAKGKKVPVIMMTGMMGSDAFSLDAVQQWGVNAFLPKGADLPVVLRKIRELTNGVRQGRG